MITENCPVCLTPFLCKVHKRELRLEPAPGDIILCTECMAVLIAAPDTSVDVGTGAQLKELSEQDPDLHLQINLMLAEIRMNKHRKTVLSKN